MLGEVSLLFVAGAGVAWSVYASWRDGRCPRCRAKALKWTYARKDGGPDARYSHNPRYCASCGFDPDAEDEGDGLEANTVSAGGGLPVAISVDVDPPSTVAEVKQVEAALLRMRERPSSSARRKIYQRTRDAITDAHALEQLELGAERIELDISLAAVADGATLSQEMEVLRNRLRHLGFEKLPIEHVVGIFRRDARPRQEPV